MPLVKLSANAAIENRKTNPFSTWGDRGASNRVEPMTLPNFAVPFKLERGESIFTVGSCFARNVETELIRRGFRIPAREIFRLPEFAKVETGVINNYGTPSIYNEIAWAFGEQPFVVEDHLLEIMPGKFADQHLTPSLRPESLDVVKARREAITASYRAAAECRTIIMTLGLSEVWFDTKTNYYLNVSPRPAMLRQFPDRYELHVLSYEEIYSYLSKAIDILRRNCSPDMRMLLTVSPVPLTNTHREEDVIVANAYSKAVLRTAAETIVTQLPFVTYYPSFESVSLTDRKIAWMDDLIHVSDAIVKINVGRMVDAYAGPGEGDDKAAIDEGGEPIAIQRAQAARSNGGDIAARFFAEHGSWSQTSLPFALEHARFVLDAGQPDTALSVLSAHRESNEPAVVAMLCEVLLLNGKADEALATIGRLNGQRVKSVSLWDAVFNAALAVNDANVALSVLNTAIAHVPVRKAHFYFLAARAFRDRRDAENAIRFYQVAIESGRAGLANLELADYLVELRRIDEAREVMQGFRPEGSGEITRYRKLVDLLGLPAV